MPGHSLMVTLNHCVIDAYFLRDLYSILYLHGL